MLNKKVTADIVSQPEEAEHRSTLETFNFFTNKQFSRSQKICRKKNLTKKISGSLTSQLT